MRGGRVIGFAGWRAAVWPVELHSGCGWRVAFDVQVEALGKCGEDECSLPARTVRRGNADRHSSRMQALAALGRAAGTDGAAGVAPEPGEAVDVAGVQRQSAPHADQDLQRGAGIAVLRQAKRLIERVRRILPSDPSGACQRLLTPPKGRRADASSLRLRSYGAVGTLVDGATRDTHNSV